MIRFILLFLSIHAMGQLRVIEPIKYLALGDSYTIGASVNYQERWPSQLYDSLGSLGLELDTLVYIARTGWTTSNLKSAIASSSLDNDFNLVSVLIGVNNQYQGKPFTLYKDEFSELIETALSYVNSDTSQLFVVSIPDYAYTPFGDLNSTISNELDVYNQFARDYCDSLSIDYYNITDFSRRGLDETNLVAIDGLHPSGIQYGLWVDLIMSNYQGLLTSLKEVPTTSLNIYPNPTQNTISFSGEKNEYSILNLAGTRVQYGIKSEKIDVSNLSQGIYFLKVGRQINKFVKE